MFNRQLATQFFRTREQFATDFGHIGTRILILTLLSFIFAAISLGNSTATPVISAELQSLTQTVSILLGVSTVVLGIYLSQYHETSSLDQIASTTKENSDFAIADYHSKISTINSRRGISAHRLLTKKGDLSEFVLRDSVNQYFILRYFWDGCWYQIDSSPFSETPSTTRTKIQIMHEVTICAFECFHQFTRMKNRGLFVTSDRFGTNGAIWTHEYHSRIVKNYGLEKRPRTISLIDANAVLLFICSLGFLLNEELHRHEEQLLLDPLRTAEFYTEVGSLLTWIFHLNNKLLATRLVAIETRCKMQVDEEILWQAILTKAKIDQKLLAEKQEKISNTSISAARVLAKKYRLSQLYFAGLFQMMFGVIFLAIGPIYGTVQAVLGETSKVVFIHMQLFFGLCAVLSALAFVLEIAMPRIKATNFR